MFKKIKKVIEIEGMHCEGCVNRVTNVLSSISGVKNCKVSLEDKKAYLVLSKEIPDFIFQEKIENIGFQMKKNVL